MMDTFSLEMAPPSVWRRFWPELLLLLGLTRYQRLALAAPALSRSSDLSSIAIDVDASGQPFLFYSMEGGGIAHVLLPLD